ncbi:MAG TPA: glycosyltransferase family 39 protein [Terriglobales bacterium]|nr:glycosyltransferase family 39 protein [Terriglobales bacterium]
MLMRVAEGPQVVIRSEPSRGIAPCARGRLHIVIILLLWLLIYVPGLFAPPLLDDADSVHAEAAREMVVRNDWVTLHANGIRYLEKAPLMYWSMAASFKVFGVHEWSARLPLALGMLATLLAIYQLGKRVYGSKAGLYATVAVATGFGPYIYTRILIPDLLVGLWLTLGFHFFLATLEEEKPSRRNCWGLAATAALNVLTKGLIGLVFPIGIILVFLVLTRNLKHVLKLRLFSSAVVFLLIAAPWHILAGLHNPTQVAKDGTIIQGFFWFYFVNEHFLRYLNKRFPRDYDTVPLLVFWALVLAWVWPWCMFVVQALGQVPHKLRDFARQLTREQRGSLLFAIWTIVVVGFFSFSTRQEYYTIPALPALASLLGGWLQKEADSDASSRERKWGRISSAVLLAVGIGAFAIGMVMMQLSEAAPVGVELSELLKKNPDMYALSLGHMFDLTPQALGLFRIPLAGVSIALLLGTALNWWFRRRNHADRANVALTVMMIAVLYCVHAALIEFSPTLTSKKLAEAVSRVYEPGDQIVIGGEYEAGSTMNFYTGQNVLVLSEKRANLWYGSRFPDAPHVWETPESFARLWTGPQRVFFWTDEDRPKVLDGKPAFELAHSGGKTIWMNRPL